MTFHTSAPHMDKPRRYRIGRWATDQRLARGLTHGDVAYHLGQRFRWLRNQGRISELETGIGLATAAGPADALWAPGGGAGRSRAGAGSGGRGNGMSSRDQMTTDDEKTGYEVGFLNGVEYFASVLTTALCGTGDQRLEALAFAFNDEVVAAGDPIPEEFAEAFCTALAEQGYSLPEGDLREVIWDWHELKKRLRQVEGGTG